MVTYLAILFVVMLLAAVVYGFGIVMRRPPTQEELSTEQCSICRTSFPKDALVERPIGDYKVLWFCTSCIDGLSKEVHQRQHHP